MFTTLQHRLVSLSASQIVDYSPCSTAPCSTADLAADVDVVGRLRLPPPRRRAAAAVCRSVAACGVLAYVLSGGAPSARSSRGPTPSGRRLKRYVASDRCVACVVGVTRNSAPLLGVNEGELQLERGVTVKRLARASRRRHGMSCGVLASRYEAFNPSSENHLPTNA